jgi:hypothetical protein
MFSTIWSGAGNASDIFFLAAAIVAFVDWLIAITGRHELSKGLLTVSIVLLALGLLAL